MTWVDSHRPRTFNCIDHRVRLRARDYKTYEVSCVSSAILLQKRVGGVATQKARSKIDYCMGGRCRKEKDKTNSSLRKE
jgi:hypothetical protein